ncbi:hypothetical protein Syun_001850 [Stephania yunnanensis]|uniref:Uncharacterized protein n=1 Tax=Stephania yunnanensis TaxID=152371 RepID=A0AAP0LHK3_9MAGN
MGLTLPNGQCCIDQRILQQEAVAFFKDVYTGDSSNGLSFPVRNQFPSIPAPLINSLSALIADEEVRSALFEMSPVKAPGLDVITALFYQSH